MAGVGSPFENSCILTAVGVVALIVNSFLITHVGRRRIFLIWGLVVCGLCQMIIAALYTARPTAESSRKAIVGFSVVYICAYNVSVPRHKTISKTDLIQGMISSYAWLSGGELPSQRLRSHTFGLAAAVGFLGAVS